MRNIFDLSTVYNCPDTSVRHARKKDSPGYSDSAVCSFNIQLLIVRDIFPQSNSKVIQSNC